MIEWIVSGLLLLGAGLMLVASLGLWRMPDILCRMHTTTKAGALGGGLMVAAVAVYFDEPGVVTRAVAIVVFIILTAPVAGHIIGRAAYFVGAELWSRTVIDELRGRYDPETHTLRSSDSDKGE